MSAPCTVIGITGGISTGKSSFSRLLQERLGARLFDADRAARSLTEEDDAVRALLRERFGEAIFKSENLNRAALRAIIFADTEAKRALEQILHPRIRQRWASEAATSRKTGDFFLADIPLLYETDGQTLCDCVVVVACSPATQLQRLIARTGLPEPDAKQMIAAQMPLEKKIARADHVFWNNGPRETLARQADLIAHLLK